MDKTKSGQEDRNLISAVSSGSEDAGRSGNNDGQPEEASSDGEPIKNSKWTHDKEMNHERLRSGLEVMKTAIEVALAAEKRKLADLMAKANSFRK